MPTSRIALVSALSALRPADHRQARRRLRRRGDRESRQAAVDGAAAAEHADVVIVTTTIRARRTRAEIRRAVMVGAPRAIESATVAAPSPRRSPCSSPGMCSALPGKGHETGQIVGGEAIPFSDINAVGRHPRGGGGGMSGPVDLRRVSRRDQRPAARHKARDDIGHSIDSRTLAPGHAFFAIKGDRFDGHDSSPRRSLPAPVCGRRQGAAAGFRQDQGLVVVRRRFCARRARDLGGAARARSGAGWPRSPEASEDRHQGDARPARWRRKARSISRPPRSTNHWGVPLNPFPASPSGKVRHLRDRHEPAGEIGRS